MFVTQVSSLCAALHDKNALVGRAVLDIVSVLFPLHQSFLVPADLTTILSAALQTLLKRDVSLNRRLYSWLLGTGVDKSQLANRLPSLTPYSASPQHKLTLTTVNSDEKVSSLSHLEPYFEAFSKVYLVNALKMTITLASLSARRGLYKSDCILPYRILRVLVDKPEVGLPVLNDVMFDLVCCLKQQISDLGGLGSAQGRSGKPLKARGGVVTSEDSTKKQSKKGALKAEILQSSNLFFNSLDSDVLWKWVTDLLRDTCSLMFAEIVSEKSTSKNERELVVREKDGGDEEETNITRFTNVDHHEASQSSSPTSELVEADKSDAVDHRQQGMEGRNGGVLVEPRSVSSQVPSSSSSVVSNAEKREFSFVIDLLKFLIQSLPLVS